MIRAAVHRLVIVLAMAPLLLAFAALKVFTLFALTADRIHPRARWGNCWTYAVARWGRHGGYLLLRAADDVKVMNAVDVPHAIWGPRLGVYRMTYPLHRKASKWLPFHALLHRFEVWHGDIPHAANWTPSSSPEPWQKTQAPRG